MSSTRGSSSIFESGNLKPGIYKIQNLYTEAYLDIQLHSMEVCCRPASNLGVGRGLVDPGNPSQFCSPVQGTNEGIPVFVTSYPVAWRIERAEDTIYRGFEYVRFHWGPTKRTWDLWAGCKDNGAPVKFSESCSNAWQLWKLIPTEVEGGAKPPQPSDETLGLDPLPPYNGNERRRSSTHVESESDDFGTVVTEVTIVTTRKKYRVEDA